MASLKHQKTSVRAEPFMGELSHGTLLILRELESRSHRWTAAKELDKRNGTPSTLLRPLVSAGLVERNRVASMSGRMRWLFRITALGQERLRVQP